MLRPIQPLVEYAINYDYISKVLCINKDKPEMSCKGTCQLMKKMEQQQEKDFQSLRILIEEYPIGFVELISLEVKSILNTNTSSSYAYHSNYKYLHLSKVFQPPTLV